MVRGRTLAAPTGSFDEGEIVIGARLEPGAPVPPGIDQAAELVNTELAGPSPLVIAVHSHRPGHFGAAQITRPKGKPTSSAQRFDHPVRVKAELMAAEAAPQASR